MKLSIYEVYVNIEDQPQSDRMKQICIDYGLPYWDSKIGFRYDKGLYSCFDYFSGYFAVYNGIPNNKTQVTESEFLELVKINFANSK